MYPDKIGQLKGLGLGASNHWTEYEKENGMNSCSYVNHVTGTVEFTIPVMRICC